jgi:hypothetical protein
VTGCAAQRNRRCRCRRRRKKSEWDSFQWAHGDDNQMRFHPIPKDWQLPSVSMKEMWMLWHYGNRETRIRPHREIVRDAPALRDWGRSTHPRNHCTSTPHTCGFFNKNQFFLMILFPNNCEHCNDRCVARRPPNEKKNGPHH